MLEEAIALDPKYALAYTKLGWAYILDWRHGWSKPLQKSMDRAVREAGLK